MFRCFAALAATLALAAAAIAADTKKLTIRWHGQSFFEIVSSAGTRIVLDPHSIDAFGRQSAKADLVCISHLHNDHTQLSSVGNYDPKKFKEMVRLGLKEGKGDRKLDDWNPIDEQFKDVHIRTVGVYHDDTQGMERGKNAVFVLDVDGLHIVHLGDLGHLLSPAQVKKIGPVDVLMIPIGGVYTINGSEAKKVIAQLKPKRYILPMHYGVRGFESVLPADEFLEDQKTQSIHRPRGNELVIALGAKPPAEPIIEMLNWESK
jgi:L-ascorbate metabolism protein UlaG (beta-lactamase superfamily)